MKNLKIEIDWKAAALPALRTAGALMLGNAFVAYMIGTIKPDVALTLGLVGAIIISIMSIKRRTP